MMDWQAFPDHWYIQTLGWALLNFIWQGALVALVLKCLLAAMPGRPANLRYWITTATLFLMLGIPLLSIWKPHWMRPVSAPSESMLSPAILSIDTTHPIEDPEVRFAPSPTGKEAMASPFTTSADSRRKAWGRAAAAVLGKGIPWICLLWMAGVILAGLRTAGAVIVSRMLKKDARELDARSSQELLIRKSGIRTCVRLLESTRVNVPAVIGWLKPAVLLPAAPAPETEQADALLAHELAHIRRRDYLVNLFQAGVEILLYYHPAVWWVSGQVRTERECCCDDAAVAMCGDLRTYLHALSEAEHRRSAHKLAIAASSTPLLDRIRRLTEMNTIQPNREIVWSTGVIALAVMAMAAAGSGLMAYVPVQLDKPTIASTQSAATPAMSGMRVPKMENTRAVAKPESKAAVQPVSATVPQASAKPAPAANPAPAGQQEVRLATLKAQMKDLEARYNSSHPDIVRLRQAIAEQEQKLLARYQAGQSQEKIAGTVLDPTGGVIPGVAISLFDPDTRDPLAMIFTAANGSFEIAPPQPNFLIQFTVPGFQSQLYMRAQLGSSPVMITMELGQVKETVTVITGAPSASANRQVRQPIRVGGNVRPPKLIQKADPVYPPEARDAEVEGIVVVSALIDGDGMVKDPIVLHGHRLLHDAALTCVRQWRYTPAILNGEAWPMRLSITLIFKLDRIK